MKIRYYGVIIAAAFIFLSGCGNSGGETAEQSTEEHYLTPEEDAKNETVMEEYSEDAEFPELASFLADYYKVPGEYLQETRVLLQLYGPQRGRHKRNFCGCYRKDHVGRKGRQRADSEHGSGKGI